MVAAWTLEAAMLLLLLLRAVLMVAFSLMVLVGAAVPWSFVVLVACSLVADCAVAFAALASCWRRSFCTCFSRRFSCVPRLRLIGLVGVSMEAAITAAQCAFVCAVSSW